MRLRLVAVGTRMPPWVVQGFDDYARRLPRSHALELVEVATARRRKGEPPAGARRREAEALLGAAPKGALLVALDERGEPLSTEALARRLAAWAGSGRDVALLVGGPDGLDPACLERADARWSLSPLTLPHALVRVIVAEQIYRAWTLLEGHPYHRA